MSRWAETTSWTTLSRSLLLMVGQRQPRPKSRACCKQLELPSLTFVATLSVAEALTWAGSLFNPENFSLPISKGPLRQPVQTPRDKQNVKDANRDSNNSRPWPPQATAQGREGEGGSSDPVADHASDDHHLWVPELILEELGEGSKRRGNFHVPEPRPVVHSQVRRV